MPEGMRNYTERFNTEASSGCIKLGEGGIPSKVFIPLCPSDPLAASPWGWGEPVSVPAAANRGKNTGIQVAMGLADSSSNVRISSSC